MDKIEAAGGKAIIAKADVSDAAAVKRMFDAAETAFCGVGVLVSNSGIMNLANIGGGDVKRYGAARLSPAAELGQKRSQRQPPCSSRTALPAKGKETCQIPLKDKLRS